jgi:ATP-dependent DNA helicase RecG
MMPTTLDALLHGGEWTGAEFKSARNALPKSVFETVSAFANTRGGLLVPGVTQDGERFEVSGVAEPDKVQNDFLSVLHADGKVSHDVEVTEHRLVHDGQVVLAFHVAENPRTRKPVYLDGDIRRTFLRKGGGDYRAQPHELERLLRDASEDRWDSQPFTRVDLDDGVFHPASLRWYRDRFHATNPGFDVEQPHHDFLHEWGYLGKDGGKLLPTRGARKLIPKHVLDVRFLGYARGDDFGEARWIDRYVSEVNVIETWQQLLAKYLLFMPKTFRDIDPATLERRDAPAGFRVFREAAMNLLIHQDYGDHARKAVIEFFTEGIQFWNPGDSFADEKHLNPAIAMAIRRIGMCEQAGAGLRMMQREWRALGHAMPVHTNDRARKSFTTFLPEPRALGESTAQVAPGVTPEVAPEVTPEVTPEVGRLVDALDGAMSRAAHMAALGLVEMTIPDKPNSPLQRYRLTDAGKTLRARRDADSSQEPP